MRFTNSIEQFRTRDPIGPIGSAGFGLISESGGLYVGLPYAVAVYIGVPFDTRTLALRWRPRSFRGTRTPIVFLVM
jgi:hypothetical protein